MIVIKYENHCVFNVIIKQSFDYKSYLVDIVAALWALKHAMDELNIQSVQQERVLDFSKTIRDFKTFIF